MMVVSKWTDRRVAGSERRAINLCSAEDTSFITETLDELILVKNRIVETSKRYTLWANANNAK